MAYIQNFNKQKTPEELQAEQLSSVKSGSSSISASENSAPAGNFAELRNYISQSSIKPTDAPVANAQTTAAIKTPEPVQNTATAKIPASNFANIQDYVNRNSQQNTGFQTGGLIQDINVNLNKLPVLNSAASRTSSPVQNTAINQIKNEVRYKPLVNPAKIPIGSLDDMFQGLLPKIREQMNQSGNPALTNGRVDKLLQKAMLKVREHPAITSFFSDEKLKKDKTELSSEDINDILNQLTNKGY